MKAFSAQISGIVQGVGFRYATRSAAHRLGACGYVRNLPDGSVEVVAEGADEIIEQLKRWLSSGPGGAVVEDIRLTELPYRGQFHDFTIEF